MFELSRSRFETIISSGYGETLPCFSQFSSFLLTLPFPINLLQETILVTTVKTTADMVKNSRCTNIRTHIQQKSLKRKVCFNCK